MMFVYEAIRSGSVNIYSSPCKMEGRAVLLSLFILLQLSWVSRSKRFYRPRYQNGSYLVGKWDKWINCTRGKAVSGILGRFYAPIEMTPKEGLYPNNLFLIGATIECTGVDGQPESHKAYSASIQYLEKHSSQGPRMSPSFCKEGQHVRSISLRMQKDQGEGDNGGVITGNLKCTRERGKRSKKVPLHKYWSTYKLNSTYWTDFRDMECPSRYAIGALQFRYDDILNKKGKEKPDPGGVTGMRTQCTFGPLDPKKLRKIDSPYGIKRRYWRACKDGSFIYGISGSHKKNLTGGPLTDVQVICREPGENNETNYPREMTDNRKRRVRWTRHNYGPLNVCANGFAQSFAVARLNGSVSSGNVILRCGKGANNTVSTNPIVNRESVDIMTKSTECLGKDRLCGYKPIKGEDGEMKGIHALCCSMSESEFKSEFQPKSD